MIYGSYGTLRTEERRRENARRAWSYPVTNVPMHNVKLKPEGVLRINDPERRPVRSETQESPQRVVK
jgi:hypothetical protein